MFDNSWLMKVTKERDRIVLKAPENIFLLYRKQKGEKKVGEECCTSIEESNDSFLKSLPCHHVDLGAEADLENLLKQI